MVCCSEDTAAAMGGVLAKGYQDVQRWLRSPFELERFLDQLVKHLYELNKGPEYGKYSL